MAMLTGTTKITEIIYLYAHDFGSVCLCLRLCLCVYGYTLPEPASMRLVLKKPIFSPNCELSHFYQ